MRSIENGILFSKHFNIQPNVLSRLGVFDPNLKCDTEKFINPLKLIHSQHREFAEYGHKLYIHYFEKIFEWLSLCEEKCDYCWEEARAELKFHEIKGTCLGYGKGTISGSGWGDKLIERLLIDAKRIIELGIKDPHLFPLMSLFEDGIGPDRISDMTTNIIFFSLKSFNRRILKELGGIERKGYRHKPFLTNPYNEKEPIILVPNDILDPLLSNDQTWRRLIQTADSSAYSKIKVSRHIAHIWADKVYKNKKRFRAAVLNNKDTVGYFLGLVKTTANDSNLNLDANEKGSFPEIRAIENGIPMDLSKENIKRLVPFVESIVKKYPLEITLDENQSNLYRAYEGVKCIVQKYKYLIENGTFKYEIYDSHGKFYDDKSFRDIFFLISYHYCHYNNIHLSVKGSGAKDSIFFYWENEKLARVSIDIELSSDKDLIKNVESYLLSVKQGIRSTKYFFILINTEGLANVHEVKKKLENIMREQKDAPSELIIVNF